MKNFFSFEDNPNDKIKLEKNKQAAFRNNVLFTPRKEKEFPNLWDSFFGKKEEKPKDKGFFNW